MPESPTGDVKTTTALSAPSSGAFGPPGSEAAQGAVSMLLGKTRLPLSWRTEGCRGDGEPTALRSDQFMGEGRASEGAPVGCLLVLRQRCSFHCRKNKQSLQTETIKNPPPSPHLIIAVDCITRTPVTPFFPRTRSFFFFFFMEFKLRVESVFVPNGGCESYLCETERKRPERELHKLDKAVM